MTLTFKELSPRMQKCLIGFLDTIAAEKKGALKPEQPGFVKLLSETSDPGFKDLPQLIKNTIDAILQFNPLTFGNEEDEENWEIYVGQRTDLEVLLGNYIAGKL